MPEDRPNEVTRPGRRGPSWRAVAGALVVIGIAALVLGFDASFYAEYGGREETERAIPCIPQPDGTCRSEEMTERQARREPKLMAKLDQVGGRLVMVGVVSLLGAIVLFGIWAWSKSRSVDRAQLARARGDPE